VPVSRPVVPATRTRAEILARREAQQSASRAAFAQETANTLRKRKLRARAAQQVASRSLFDAQTRETQRKMAQRVVNRRLEDEAAARASISVAQVRSSAARTQNIAPGLAPARVTITPDARTTNFIVRIEPTATKLSPSPSPQIFVAQDAAAAVELGRQRTIPGIAGTEFL